MLNRLSLKSLVLSLATIAMIPCSRAEQKFTSGQNACERSSAVMGFDPYEAFARETTALVERGSNNSTNRIEISKNRVVNFRCRQQGVPSAATEEELFTFQVRTISQGETYTIPGKANPPEKEIFRDEKVVIQRVNFQFGVRRSRKMSDRQKTDELSFALLGQIRVRKVNPDGTLGEIIRDVPVDIDHENPTQSIQIPEISGALTLKCDLQ
jgi:hypothetical protein